MFLTTTRDHCEYLRETLCILNLGVVHSHEDEDGDRREESDRWTCNNDLLGVCQDEESVSSLLVRMFHRDKSNDKVPASPFYFSD